ncbi:LemA family protein [Rappaport israeli]|uniref:LemA family protein n=1 Tax=Rappaport israeli TaxID=1839807 RepID=UPI0009304A60|nr:LemA family protein [Rappaport israeli]
MAGWIGLALVVMAVVFVVGIYNRLVAKRNEVKNGFAQIDVQLSRRYELIPNLVAAAKKYLTHEQETLTQVTAARNQAKSVLEGVQKVPEKGELARLAGAEQALGRQLGGLMATFESYPELKGDATIEQLMEELSSTENRVAFARQYYNDVVNVYNTAVESFPENMVARVFGFSLLPWLEIEDVAVKRQTLRIDLDS